MDKKRIIIPISIFLGVLALGMSSNAYARYTLAASNGSFNIAQDMVYYLKGNFNSWEQQVEYRFVNNTASMSEETNKIREYKLENISLSKNDQLKVWAQNDVWFKDGASNCTYEQSWTNDESFSDNDDRNYIVPMTSNTYTFLLKFYSDGSSKIDVTANKDVLFFVPSNRWKNASATFAIEQYNNSNQWVQNVTTSVESPAGTFKFNIGTTYTKYKFARRNTSNTETWNASNIQIISNSDTNNCFSLWDNFYSGSEVWSEWNAVGGTETNVSCGSWSTM